MLINKTGAKNKIKEKINRRKKEMTERKRQGEAKSGKEEIL